MTDTIDRIKASKRKCKHQRDNWKARALVYQGAGRMVRVVATVSGGEACRDAGHDGAYR